MFNSFDIQVVIRPTDVAKIMGGVSRLVGVPQRTLSGGLMFYQWSLPVNFQALIAETVRAVPNRRPRL